MSKVKNSNATRRQQENNEEGRTQGRKHSRKQAPASLKLLPVCEASATLHELEGRVMCNVASKLTRNIFIFERRMGDDPVEASATKRM
jgi:hypothetical protein